MHEKSPSRDDRNDRENRENREGIDRQDSGRLPSSDYEGSTGNRGGSREGSEEEQEEQNVPSRDRSSELDETERSQRDR